MTFSQIKNIQIYSLIFCLLCPFVTHSRSMHPLFMSQSGAGGASLREDFSFLINPATLTFQNKNKMALAYAVKQKRKLLVFSFVDLKTKIPLAISYQRSWIKNFTKNKTDQMNMVSSMPFSNYFSIGASVKKNIQSGSWQADVGSLFRITPKFSLAVFATDLLKVRKKNRKQISFGLYHNWSNFLFIKIDASKKVHKNWIVRGGIESLFQQFLSIHLSGAWFKNRKIKPYISGGVAVQSPKLVLEYAIQGNKKEYQQALSLILKL